MRVGRCGDQPATLLFAGRFCQSGGPVLSVRLGQRPCSLRLSSRVTLWSASVADVAACVARADQPVGLYTHKYFLVWQLWQLVASVLMCRAAVFALASVFVRIRMHAAWIRHARREAEVAAVAATVAAVATEPSSADHRWISELDDVPPELPSKTSVVILVLVALGSVCVRSQCSRLSPTHVGRLLCPPSLLPTPPLVCVRVSNRLGCPPCIHRHARRACRGSTSWDMYVGLPRTFPLSRRYSDVC